MAVRQTRLGQLPMDDPLQVHRELAVGQGDTVGENVLPQPLDHGGGDIIVGLKAAGTNPGTDGGQDVPGVTAVTGRSSWSTAWGAMPRAVPRQPECTAAMALCTGSYRSTGIQSA